ncbi:chaperonin 10-like protein [Paraphoma chrysanthemicola]|uniref:Chaperonin 10-like protein n=1 Tax=Paraphoma chrysanthemicola TaxID=798071 RepID=A0A8K0QT49_9PLEO|nr:chaperonin 10-like protein [Paraphoma chrysanthemicola]
MGTPLPCTGSHEGAGTIVAVGSAVKDFSIGERVMAGIIYRACGTCSDCQGPENYRQYCQFSGGYCGVTTHGFFAEYARIDATQAAKLPDAVTFETAAPLACAGCTIYRGVVLSGLIKGLELTRNGGADVVVDARKGFEAVVKDVHAVTNGEGVACTLNVSDANSAMATCCGMTRMHGTVIQIAQPDNVVVPFCELIFRDIRVRGSLIASPNEARDMLALVARHGISVHTNAFNGLDEIAKMVELAHSGRMKGKGIVIVDKEQVAKEQEMGATV